MNRIIRPFICLVGMLLVLFLSASLEIVEAKNDKILKWPATMIVQEGTSQNIVATGVGQSIEDGLRHIGIDTTTSYMVMNKQSNNYYYARYGEGTLLYGFGPERDAWKQSIMFVGHQYAVSMIQDYQAYMEEHPETFKIVMPLREIKKDVYVLEVIVNTWFKQVEYPQYMQLQFSIGSTGPPKVVYIMTDVKDAMLRKQLYTVL